MAEWRIYASINLVIIGLHNGLSSNRCQAIIETNADFLWIGHPGKNLSEILINSLKFWFNKMRLEISSAKCRQSCLVHRSSTKIQQWFGTRCITWTHDYLVSWCMICHQVSLNWCIIYITILYVRIMCTNNDGKMHHNLRRKLFSDIFLDGI